jgi:4-hydroxybenzoyl-CoA thioesterase
VNIDDGYTITVHWGDCDPARIVFYPNYFKWFDEAGWALLARLFPDKRVLLERHGIVGFPIAEAQARFLRPSAQSQTITFKSTVESWQEKRFTILHQGYRDGELLLEGREVRFVGRLHPQDPKRLQAMVLPAEIVEAFRSAQK